MAEVRPIDANALVLSLSNSYADLCKICDSMQESEEAKEVCRGELITFLEAILRVKGSPTLDYEPVRHGEWKYYHKKNKAVCTACSFERNLDDDFGRAISCPNCGARMEGWKNNG